MMLPERPSVLNEVDEEWCRLDGVIVEDVASCMSDYVSK